MPNNTHTYKISAFRYFLRQDFIVFTENNLDEDLDNIREIALSNDFNVQHVKKVIVHVVKNNNL